MECAWGANSKACMECVGQCIVKVSPSNHDSLVGQREESMVYKNFEAEISWLFGWGRELESDKKKKKES